MDKHYIGDGVYIEYNEYSELILTTMNGIYETNRIALEPVVLSNFLEYIERLRKELNQSNKSE